MSYNQDTINTKHAAKQMGYLVLLKNNSHFRNLWFGQVVSDLGDWLNSIAIYSLVLELHGSGMAMATVMAAKLLPYVFISPFAGVALDCPNRRRVLIVTDILRFFVVLCFLFIKKQTDLWLLYFLVILHVTLSGFFGPARSAIIPSLTERKDLITANALSGSTWSAMLAIGAALGGLVVKWFGIQIAFILDASTFLVSAFFISKIPPGLEQQAFERKKTTPIKDRGLTEALSYITNHPKISGLIFLKPGLAVVGGIMTLIPLFANKIFSDPADVSNGIGLLYSCRGLGALVGPILVRRLFGESEKILHHSIYLGFLIGGIFYIVFAKTNSLWLGGLCVALAHSCISVIWVYSSALIHLNADNEYLGRIFSLEWTLLTLVMAISNFGTGMAVDYLGMTISETASLLGFFLVVPGILWFRFLLRVKAPQDDLHGKDPVDDPKGLTSSD